MLIKDSQKVAEFPKSYQASGLQLVQVLVDCPGVDKPLTYAIPTDLTVRIGDILSVPVGDRYVGAIALQFLDTQTELEFAGEIKFIHNVVSTGLFPDRYWELLIHTADYYRTPLIQTVKAALPPKLLDRSRYRIQINRIEDPSPDQGNLFGSTKSIFGREKLSTAAQTVWEFIQSHADENQSISRRSLYQKLPRHAASGMRVLLQLGYISTYLEPSQRPQPKFEDVLVLLQIPNHEITEKQKELLLTLQRLGGEVARSQFIKLAKTSYGTIQTLVKKGWVALDRREVLRLGGKNHLVSADQPKPLTVDQQQALAQIQSLKSPNLQLLLHGVTGSGKTEVYLQAIAPILNAGKSALVLVPEIGLTPQLTDRFRARFGDRKVNVYHSQLSDGERFDTWRHILMGEPQVVIGTRSAIFAPLVNLGLIILDEEHDPSFKQDQVQPCYHARTLAQWRSQLESCPLVLGSATPSLETLYFLETDNSNLVTKSESESSSQLISPPTSSLYAALPNRIGNKPMPVITVVDMRLEFQNKNWSIFSQSLQTAITEMHSHGKQGILFIHRRGYSTFVSCRSCGYVVNCPRCDVSLSYHQNLEFNPVLPVHIQSGNLHCHYCNYSQLKPSQCPSCGSPYFKHFGSGTQKVEQEIAKLFPELKVIRFDSDTTRNKDQHRLLLEQFQAGEADLLIGTQMLTKGIDIPQVTLVGVVSADGLLNFSDYRASERAFQTLTQVAGRAGRGDDLGKVIIQTYTPEHPVIQAVKTYAFDEFMQTELSHRTELNYPPVGQMALIHLSSIDAIAVETAAKQVAEFLISQSIKWDILGPSPALITKVNNRYRWQVLIKFPSTVSYDSLPNLEQLRAQINSNSIRITIDVDPTNIM